MRRESRRDRSPIATRPRRDDTPHPRGNHWREGSPLPVPGTSRGRMEGSPYQPNHLPTPRPSHGRMEGSPHPPNQDAWWAARTNAQAESAQHQQSPAQENEGLLNLLLEEVNSLKQQIRVQLQGDIIDELHITVTPELKEKIWSNKFVDLSQLLEKNQQVFEEEVHKSRVCGYQDEEGNVTFKAKKATKSNLTIEQWSSAFNTFISVYIQKHLNRPKGL